MWTAHWAGQDIPATLQRALGPAGLIGIDQDAEAIEAADKTAGAVAGACDAGARQLL